MDSNYKHWYSDLEIEIAKAANIDTHYVMQRLTLYTRYYNPNSVISDLKRVRSKLRSNSFDYKKITNVINKVKRRYM